MRTPLILVLPLLLFLSGCAHIISDTSLDRADRSIEFGELRKNPDAFRGKFVILGGLITGVRQVREGVQLEVVEYPLDSEEMPDTSSGSGGRFLVVFPPDVGYATFKPGVLVTMAGEVAGKAVKPLENVAYTYPVLVVKEIHIVIRPPAGDYRGY
ncbi:MAG TPA: Slp family lipoprotein [Geobacteraceae bacterium]